MSLLYFSPSLSDFYLFFRVDRFSECDHYIFSLNLHYLTNRSLTFYFDRISDCYHIGIECNILTISKYFISFMLFSFFYFLYFPTDFIIYYRLCRYRFFEFFQIFPNLFCFFLFSLSFFDRTYCVLNTCICFG